MTPSEFDRFWSKVRVGGPGCWEWRGAKKKRNGYGTARVGGRMLPAHRVAFAMLREPPGSLHVLHRCDNPACVRPEHLFLGTNADNVADRCAKGRSARLGGERCPSSKLTNSEVVEIRARYASGGVSQMSLAVEFGVSQRAIGFITRGRTWRDLPVVLLGACAAEVER